MKSTLLILTLIFGLSSINAQKKPLESKTVFNEASMTQPILDWNGNTTTIGDILAEHKGKTVFLYVWASWCPDCIIGFPELKIIQQKFPEAVYLFLSLDRVGKETVWKDAVKKYELEGEHYWFNTDWKNDFTDYIELNWVPRYMLIDSEGNIAHYYSIKADDPEMVEVLEKLLKE